jgi:hypothetical protein
VATELGFLRGFALRDQGDEADPLHLPRGKRQAVEAAGIDRVARAELGDIGDGLWWSSSDKNRTSGLPTFPSCSLTDPIASRDGERSNSRVT